jgi:hypothetical protein
MPFQLVRPDIETYGHRAGFQIRNMEILGVSEALVVFWDGTTPGFADIISAAAKQRKRSFVIPLV